MLPAFFATNSDVSVETICKRYTSPVKKFVTLPGYYFNPGLSKIKMIYNYHKKQTANFYTFFKTKT